MNRATTMTALRGPRLAAAVAAAAAAIAILGPPSLAQAATTVPAKPIGPAACRPSTFNVHYGRNKEKCYTGHGTKTVRIPDVHLVTTGNNEGFLIDIKGGRAGRIAFVPRERLQFPAARHVELVTIHIA